LPGGAGLDEDLLRPPLELPFDVVDDDPPAPSSVNTATAFMTSQPTASKTCRAREASNPISTHVLTATSCLDDPPLLLPLALALLRVGALCLGGEGKEEEEEDPPPLLPLLSWLPLKELDLDDVDDGPRDG